MAALRVGVPPRNEIRMRRFIPLLIAGVALVATACGDAIAPTRSDDAALTRVSGPLSSAKNGYVGQNALYTHVIIRAAGGDINVGPFTVNFPANAVCTRATTQYEHANWDAPCTPRNHDVYLQAAYWTENGVPFVEFLADLRFVPGKTVTLSFPASLLPSDFDPAVATVAYWKRDRNGRIVNHETLVTSYHAAADRIQSVIKHFSGYVITSGREAEQE